jgi:hypothetical protein
MGIMFISVAAALLLAAAWLAWVLLPTAEDREGRLARDEHLRSRGLLK